MNIKKSAVVVLAICLVGSICAKAQTTNTTQQILQMHTFREGLVWIGGKEPGEAENKELLEVLTHLNEEWWTSGVEQFLKDYPDSPWAASLHYDYASFCRRTGRTTKALEHYEGAWALAKNDATSQGQRLGGTILANWTDLLASLGRLEKLQELVAIGDQWQFVNSQDRNKFEGAKNSYFLMREHPEMAYRCGTFALKAIGGMLQPNQNLESLVEVPSPTNGFSMADLVDLSKKYGFNLVAVRRSLQTATGGQDLIVPSVVHWRQNHYAAILGRQGDLYLVSDPTFGHEKWLPAEVINEEASGEFLIPAASQTNGWPLLARNETENIHGMGLPDNIDDGKDKGAGCICPHCPGMPVWWVSQPYINVWMADEPISYRTSRGEPFTFRITYKQRDMRPSPSDHLVSNAGWNNSWASYIRLDSDSTCSSGCITALVNSYATVYLPGGGEVDYNPGQGYDPETRLMLLQQYPNAFGGLQNSADTGKSGLVLVHADGSQDVYGLAMVQTPISGDFYSSEFLRTRHIDPNGDTTWFDYDAINFNQYLLANVLDPDGRTNTLTYTANNLLSAVTNAYGQSAHFKYDSKKNLTNIVDAAGMSSSLTYDTNNNPTALITPYGTNHFSIMDNGSSGTNSGEGDFGGHNVIDRAVLVTDPVGATNLYLYRYDCSSDTPLNMSASFSSSNVPTNTPLGTLDTGASGTNFLTGVCFRNSFYWGPRQYAGLSTTVMTNFTANDYLRGQMQHWLEDTDQLDLTGYLSVEQDASPDGTNAGLLTFYDYQGKLPGYNFCAGTNPLPSVVAWRLPNGETHYEYKVFDYFGNVTNDISTYTLPNGSVGTRTNQYIYANNTYTYQYASTSSISSYIVPDLLTKVIGADGNTIWSYGGFDSVTWTNSFYLSGNTQTNVATMTSSRVMPDYATNGVGQVVTTTFSSGGNPVTDLDYWPGTGGFPNGNYGSPYGTTFPGYSKVTSSISVAGLTTTNIYNSNGFLARTIDLQIGRTNSFGFGMDGLPIAFTNELGLNLAITWDNLLRPTSTQFPDGTYTSNRFDRLDLGGTRDRLGNWTGYGHDGARHLTSITNANNAVTLLDWCGCGALTEIIDPLSNVTSLNYDNQGNLTNVTFPDYSSLNYKLDLARRPVTLSDGAGRFLNLGYNNQDLVTTVSNANGRIFSRFFDIKDRLANSTDANGITISNTFDGLDQILTCTWPDGIGEGYGYSAQGLAFYTNRDNQVMFYGRNAAGWLMAVTNANGEVNQVTRDPAGDVLTLLDGLNHQTQWRLNQYGWVTNKIDALGRNAFQYAYNANGWLTNRTTPEKGGTGYAYDNVGNVARTIYPQLTISNAYDALNELTNMVDAVGSHNFTWTPIGLPQSEGDSWTTVSNSYSQGLRTLLTIAQSGTNWTQSYAYDAGWRMTNTTSLAGGFIYQFQSALMNTPSSILLPNGAYITNSFDSLANLKFTALANHWGHTLDGYTYQLDPLGLRTNIARNFGLTTNLVNVGYDKIAQITSWNAQESSGQPRLNEHLGFAFDAADNLLRRTNNLMVQSFTVDAANDLTNVTRTGTFTLSGATPAPATNITVNGNVAQTYGDFTFARTNLTLANGNNTFTNIAQNTYGLAVTNTFTVNLPSSVGLNSDANGSITNDGTKTLAYDSENQLTNVFVAGQWRSDFIYDGLNRRRIERDYSWSGSWVKTNETRFIYDGYLLVQERDTNNNVLATYTRGLDLSGDLSSAGGIGGLLARTDGNGSTFYHADEAGNITALMDGSENIVARYLYNPFGKLVGQWGSMASINEMQFSSMPVHRLSGMPHFPFRDLDLDIDQFLTADPIGEAGGIPLHGFVGNNPLDAVDPLGLEGYIYIGNPNPNGKPLVNEVIPDSTDQAAAQNRADWSEIAQAGWNNGGSDAGNFVMAFIPSPVEEIGIAKTAETLAKPVVSVCKNIKGSYVHEFESSMKYIGKGTEDRPAISAKQLEKVNNDKLVNTKFTPSNPNTDAQAFKDEAQKIRDAGGLPNNNLYNKVNSPGEKMLPPNK